MPEYYRHANEQTLGPSEIFRVPRESSGCHQRILQNGGNLEFRCRARPQILPEKPEDSSPSQECRPRKRQRDHSHSCDLRKSVCGRMENPCGASIRDIPSRSTTDIVRQRLLDEMTLDLIF